MPEQEDQSCVKLTTKQIANIIPVLSAVITAVTFFKWLAQPPLQDYLESKGVSDFWSAFLANSICVAFALLAGCLAIACKNSVHAGIKKMGYCGEQRDSQLEAGGQTEALLEDKQPKSNGCLSKCFR